MDTSKNLGQEFQPSRSTTSSTGQAASASSRAQEVASEAKERAGEVIDQASQKVSEAYEQASQKVGETFEQAITYSRSNPGTALLIAFGAGVGIGLLVASGMPSRSRVNRIAEPVVGALSQIALEFIR